jgi:hypothetical protein
MARQPEWLIELGIKVYGMKNLRKLPLESQKFIVESLLEVRRRIWTATEAGRNDEGRKLKLYSKAYAKKKARLKRHGRVNLRWNGEMMDSLELNVLKGGRGRLYFRGHHAFDAQAKDHIERLQEARNKATDPEHKARLQDEIRRAYSYGFADLKRNQDVADKQAHRLGYGNWLPATNGRPPNEFMMIGEHTRNHIAALYRDMVLRKALANTPAMPPVEIERWKKL